MIICLSEFSFFSLDKFSFFEFLPIFGGEKDVDL